MKNLHKTAKPLRQLALTHSGILDVKTFDAQCDLRCYAPPDELRTVVAHIWVQRRRTPTLHRTPLEVTSTPSAYLFVNTSSAFIHGVGFPTFQYNPLSAATFAGVKFHPGGLKAFWEKPMYMLHQNHIAATTIFPDLDRHWMNTIDDQSDAEIVAEITKILLDKYRPVPKITYPIENILAYIAHDPQDKTPTHIANEFHISTRRLEQLFRNNVGVTLKHAISRQRLLHAIAEANTSPDRTWTDISAEFNYSSQSHFNREFKSVTGISPSHYRQLCT